MAGRKPHVADRQPSPFSGRIRRLRDLYSQGVKRAWNNKYTSWTTGTDWYKQYNELTFYIVPETCLLLKTIGASYRMAARPVALHDGFWEKIPSGTPRSPMRFFPASSSPATLRGVL